MNKILNINLGGYALTIDDDAFEYLNGYLNNIKSRFSESDGRDEIMRDVESRLGELITQSMGNRSIVMLPDVQSVVEVMGKPEDFGGEPEAGKKGQFTSTSILTNTLKTGKRLFRDENDAVMGGVCSGIAAYVGIAEPLWIRLLFVLLAAISAGFWILLYLLLWIIVPPARSTTERLAMRGEAINVDSIAREMERGAERLSSRVGPGAKSAAGGCLWVFGKVVLAFAVFVLACVVFGVGAAWIASIVAFFSAAPYLGYISPFSGATNYLAFASLFFLLGIPVVAFCVWLAKLLFKFSVPAWLGSVAGVTWAGSLIASLFFVVFGASEFSHRASITKKMDLGTSSDTLHVEWSGPKEDERVYRRGWGDEGIRVRDGRLSINGPVQIRVRKGASSGFEYAQTVTAQGHDDDNARDNAAQVEYNSVFEGNTLRVPTELTFDAGEKYRIHEVDIALYIPVGKYVVFGKHINEFVERWGGDYAYDDDESPIHDYPGKVFRMTERGLVCADCPSFGDRDYRRDNRFEDFTFEGRFDIEIRKTDHDFGVEIEGSAADKALIQSIRTGDKLTLTTEGKPLSGKVKVLIRTNSITNLLFDDTGEVVIRGFDEGDADISVKGRSVLRGDLEVNNLDLTLNGPCLVEIDGRGHDLTATLSNGATLEAANWRVNRVNLTAHDGSKAHVAPRESKRIVSDASSSVKVDGDAENDEKEEQ